jgi:hypothetical protein
MNGKRIVMILVALLAVAGMVFAADRAKRRPDRPAARSW